MMHLTTMHRAHPATCRLVAATCALLALTPAAAATDATPAVPALEIRHDWNHRELGEPVRVTAGCPLAVLPPVDGRRNRETVGATPDGPLPSGDLAPWMTDGFGALTHHGLVLQDDPAHAVALRVTLTRAYTWDVGNKTFGMVAFKASYTDPRGRVHEKQYRAYGDTTRTWGAGSQYARALNHGLHNLLPAVARDVDVLCRGGTVAPYTYSGPDRVAGT
jgi:hypothetical protein